MKIDMHKSILAGLFALQAVWQIIISIFMSIIGGVFTLLLTVGGGLGEGQPLPGASSQELFDRLPVIIGVWMLIGFFLLITVLNLRIGNKLVKNQSGTRTVGIITSFIPILVLLISIPALFYSYPNLKLVNSIPESEFGFYFNVFCISCVLILFFFFGAILGIYGLWFFLSKKEEIPEIKNEINLP